MHDINLYNSTVLSLINKFENIETKNVVNIFENLKKMDFFNSVNYEEEMGEAQIERIYENYEIV